MTYHPLYPLAHCPPFNSVASIILVLALTFGLAMESANASLEDSTTQLRQLAQLAEYIGVDYPEAISQGQVINENEYQEMLEFSQLIVEKITIDNLDDTEASPLLTQALALKLAVQNMEDVKDIRKMTASLRALILSLMPPSTLPQSILPKDTIALSFENNCASCHGLSGDGNGPLAGQLDPAPTNFTDKPRALNRSVLGLFDAISNGIDDTAMPAFQHLTEQERWSMAFYVGAFAFQFSQAPETQTSSTITLQQIVNHNPLQLSEGKLPGVKQEIEWLRGNPANLFGQKQSPLTITKRHLVEAQSAHQQGNYLSASQFAISAYLDGFEMIENSLDTQDKILRQTIEANMMKLRSLVKQKDSATELNALISETQSLLDDADRLLSNATLSGATLFSASLVILLREGIEALLVVIALITVLIRTQRQDALRYIHFGWVSALVAGIATWAVAQSIVSISGASREIMEGVAALMAALVLLYVGVWMHSKTHAAQWQAYIQRHISAKLNAGTLWGLTALAFVAVYREIFETVLFYQSLLTQTIPSQYSYVVSGFAVGVVLLAGLAWGIMRYSIQLPVTRFFAVTTYLMLALAFVLMGKAVSALQEAALISMTPLPISFEINWMGIKSTWQGILAQITVLVVFLVLMKLNAPAGNQTISVRGESHLNGKSHKAKNDD
ncbi:MAG: cytochrome c/FTR1 family iron permease [Pseudomonadales bacterium]|nr:cytochrome c/FTR1 family iron permease [Pseudomonadales bacterium]